MKQKTHAFSIDDLKKICDDHPFLKERMSQLAEVLNLDSEPVTKLIPTPARRSPKIRRNKPDRRYHSRRQTSEERRQIGPCSSTESESHASNVRDAGSNPARGTKHSVVIQRWIESERGWGSRPDGVSLHLTKDDLDKYIKEYWKSMPKFVPDEYSRPEGCNPSVIDVDDALYQRLKASSIGIRLWENEYREIQK